MNQNRNIHTNQTQRAGSAMIMVLLIIGVLIVISVPFLTSMVRHADNARSYRAETRTRQLADQGIQSASGILSSGNVNREWQRRNTVSPDPNSRSALVKSPFITPYMDYTTELRTLREQLAAYYLKLDEFTSRSSIGVQVEDEQGKLNLATTPDRVLENLKSLLGPSDRIDQYVTLHSVRPNASAIDRHISEPEGASVQWSSTRHPININTAHWKVIAANLVDLGEWRGDSQQNEEKLGTTIKESDEFDQSLTKELAKFIKSKTPINGWYQFESVLDDADDEEMISGTQKKLILQNARKGNLLYSNNAVKRNTSMPFCFRSYDTYTVQSQATVLNRAGSPMSETAVRSVKTTSPETSSHVIESPYEFAESLAQLTRSQGISRGNSYRIIAGPRQIYRNLNNGPSFDDDELGTWAKTRVFKSRQSDAHFQPKPNDRGNFEPYGRKISGGMEVKSLVPDGGGYKGYSTEPGGIKFWIKFNGTPPATSLFDTAESTYQSRIHFYYQEGKLFLDVADPTLEKKYTRVVADWQPEPDTWYHLGAFWKSTKYGHLAIMIDGHLVGEMKMVNEDDENLLRTISGSLSKEASASQLSSLDPGYWELGEEIVKVPGRNTEQTGGNNSNSGNTRGLGRKRTTPHEHGPQSVANPYGFSILLGRSNMAIGVGSFPHTSQSSLRADLSGIPHFDIRTTSEFGPPVRPTVCPQQYQNNQSNNVTCDPPENNNNQNTNNNNNNNNNNQWELPKSAQNIPVISAPDRPLSDFPSPALLLIYGRVSKGNSNGGNAGGGDDGQDGEPKHEIVVCDDASGNTLSNCTRGVLGTEAVNWQAEASVALLGIPVDNAGQFPTGQNGDGNIGRLVQVETEWLGPVTPYSTGGTTFLGSSNQKIPLQRGVLGTSLGENEIHKPNQSVLPVFDLRQEQPEDRGIAQGLSMLRDVTLAYKPEDKLKKRRVTIRLAKFSTAALDDVVPETVEANRVNRLLKFPSGELMSGTSTSGDDEEDGDNGEGDLDLSAHLGSTSPNAKQIGSMSGTIANLESVNGSSSYRILDEPVDASSKSLTLRRSSPGSTGALKVGDELIGFPETSSSQRLPVDPDNQPNTEDLEEFVEESDRYDQEDILRLTELSEASRGYLESTSESHNRGDRVFVLSQGMISVSALSNPLNANEETVNVKNDGLFTDDYDYYRIGREILGLRGGNMPEHPITGQGIFRGSFGTTPAAHPQNAMVFRTPHRYPDRSPDTLMDQLYADVNFHVVGVNRPGATWTGLSWEADRDPQQGSEPRLLMRTDRDTPWDEVEKRYSPTQASSVEFDQPITTDRVELLFLFGYRDGSYSAKNWRSQHGWKSTTRIKRLQLNYHTPSRTFMTRQQK